MFRRFLPALIFFIGITLKSLAGDSPWLWQIGKDDGQYHEFALAAGKVDDFRDDPTFLVGVSDPAHDWPFIQPGPDDSWAGNHAHTFSIAFGLSNVTAQGECFLSVALVDTHAYAPPKLKIFVNGQKSERQLPPGAGDASLNGHPENGKPYRFEIIFPAALLKPGVNVIDLVNDRGSWLLYDWLGLKTPAEIQLAKLESVTTASAVAIRGLIERHGKFFQPVELTLRHVGDDTTAVVTMVGEKPAGKTVHAGAQTFKLLLPAVETEQLMNISVAVDGETLVVPVTLKPVRKLTIYVLPHSHHDLGYTDFQTNVVERQMENLRKAMEISRRTENYPIGARFVWNTEALWSVDDFMRRKPDAEKVAFIDTVKHGHIALNGLYANELTGLCRPEELLQLCAYGTQLGAQCGVKVDSAMQSDVPGMTWGMATAMAQAGIRYFSLAPNYFDRIGNIMVQWQDKPFWWVSPSGKEKILVWVPWTGYALSHIIGKFNGPWVGEYQAHLDSLQFPYDISYVRWSGHGDNAEPDGEICEFVKLWNSEYAWPKFIISSTSEAFAALEKKYSDQLPQYKGDLTPYWEDGAGSSALETAMNRNNSDRLVQTETLFALRDPKSYSAVDFADAWRNILLYSEHTWGAWCSVSDSENPATRSQWKVKRAFATNADAQSKALLARALDVGGASQNTSGVDVFNTTSWPRTELVVVSAEQSAAGERVTDQAGHAIPSQRLRSGDLAFLAQKIPPLAGVRFKIGSGDAARNFSPVKVAPASLDNDLLHIRLDPQTGDIVELTLRSERENFALTNGPGLNAFAYLPGDNLADLQTSGAAKISIVENGPLVASLRIESSAPGCNGLTRELRLVAGADFVEMVNTIDKQRVLPNPHPGEGGPGGAFAQRGSKESVSFTFPFNVADGDVRLDIPFATIRPETDQIPGACKNWLPVGRWADVSNSRNGVTLVTLDAPLVEIGELSTLLGSQSNPNVWRKHIGRTQKIYSWVMNNHWGTNYRADQHGPVMFRYALRPHGNFDAVEATRIATGLSQPLCVRPVSGLAPGGESFLRVEPGDVLVTALKPGDDGKSWIVRLFGASDHDRRAKLVWQKPVRATSLSGLDEQPGTRVESEIPVPAGGLVTVRAERQSP
ncbi:MAG: polysaccharide lyase family protein [Limisphaerales bacterium]